MQEFLIDELKDLYSAEKQIFRALPKLAKAASSPELQQALLSHLKETKGLAVHQKCTRRIVRGDYLLSLGNCFQPVAFLACIPVPFEVLKPCVEVGGAARLKGQYATPNEIVSQSNSILAG